MGQNMQFIFADSKLGQFIHRPGAHNFGKEYKWKPKEKEKWNNYINGTTGHKDLDWAMKLLKKEGWIHHLARHMVACFLTRGDLWVSWEEGQAVFEELLLDADWSLNAANWQWLSASAFFHQYYRQAA